MVMLNQRHIYLNKYNIGKMYTGTFVVAGAHTLQVRTLRSYLLNILEYFVNYVICDLYLQLGRDFMKEQENQTSEGSMADQSFWAPLLPKFRAFGRSTIEVAIAFARYTIDTFVAVGLFGVLVAASRVARLLSTTGGEWHSRTCNCIQVCRIVSFGRGYSFVCGVCH